MQGTLTQRNKRISIFIDTHLAHSALKISKVTSRLIWEGLVELRVPANELLYIGFSQESQEIKKLIGVLET